MLNGKIAVVTGASRGIGKAIAMKFAQLGATVVINYNGSAQKAEEVKQSIIADGGRAVIKQCNVADYDACEAFIKEVIDQFGRIDILANNAGVSSKTSIYDFTLDEFEKVMDINVTAVFVCTQAAARIMKEQGSGVIICTSSMVGEYGQPSGCAYPASKFAVNGLVKSLSRELAKDGIRVNAVAPGVTRTDMLANLPKEMVDRVSAGIPLGRVGEPEDIANA